MREILFRGKTVKDEKWVTGYFATSDRDYAMIFSPAETCGCGFCNQEMWEKGRAGCAAYVDPETVGQYTGLTDKNGTKIFEGDIVKRQWGEHPHQCVYYTVEFEFGEFELVSVKGKNKYFIANHYEYEVIGNIHDNPELLR